MLGLVMEEPMGLDAYVDAMRRRNAATAMPHHVLIEAPGITGLAALRPDEPPGRLIVLDDRAYDLLAARLHELHAVPLSVLGAAPACEQMVRASGQFDVETGTAMVSRDLGCDRPLPDGLALRPVHRRPEDDPEGVPLEQAAAACLRADPDAASSPSLEVFTAYLRGLPGAHLLAAVDAGGEVRGTAGWAVFGTDASVFFVSSDVGWRGIGLGTAMTAAALRAAAGAGAQRACLDASEAGRPIYLRLGFEEVSPLTRFFRRPPGGS